MNPFELGTETAILRVEIKESWTPQGFSTLLHDLNDVYRRLNALDFFDRAISREKSENTRYYEKQEYDRASDRFQRLFYGVDLRRYRDDRDDYQHYPPDFEVIISTAEQFTGELVLRSIRYNSPGWVEMIGSWNPLKVIADAVAEWRKQNTERENNRVQANLEAMRIRSGVLSAVLNNEKLLSGDPNLYKGIFENILNPAYDFVSGIAVDSRITDVKLLSPGEKADDDVTVE